MDLLIYKDLSLLHYLNNFNVTCLNIFLNCFLQTYHIDLISHLYTLTTMTFVFYKEGKKFTINNATLFDIGDELTTFMITSTRGNFSEDLEAKNRDVEKEVREGIDWYHESVN